MSVNQDKWLNHSLLKKMKFSIENFFIEYDQIPMKLRIWSHLPKLALMENLIFLCRECV